MAVESATYISQLNTSYPLDGDVISEGDNHIRLGKSVLQNQFPAFGAGPVTASHTELSYVTGVTSAIQTQLNAKGAIAAQVWGAGVHDFSAASSFLVPNATLASQPYTKAQTDALVITATAPTWVPTTTAVSKTLTALEFVNVTASGQTITFPASPVAGVTRVGVAQASGVTVTYDPNGAKIMGSSGTMTNNKPGSVLVFTYLNSTLGYVVGA